MSLYSDLFYAKDVSDIFSETETLAAMLAVESALAQAQASAGIFSKEAADLISGFCSVEYLEINKLKKDISLGGNAAIPLVQQLTKAVKTRDFEASKYVHLGATSQDVVDTAMVLQISNFIKWLDLKLAALKEALITITEKHKATVMVGRTLLQQARPISFGLKTSGWLEGICRSIERIEELKSRLLVIQLSGAVGSRNTNLTDAVRSNFALNLNLAKAHSWQTQRDNMSELASKLGILSGSLGKIAKDVSLLMQTEVGEVFEGAALGKGGSSTMPHKRNPVTCSSILANAARVPHLVATMLATMPQEHERSAGLWHAEWDVLTEIIKLTAGSLEKCIDLIMHLEVDQSRMRANIDITAGLIFAENVSLALATKMGKIQAHELVEKACKVALSKKKHLKDMLIESGIEIENIDELFDPENSMGFSVEIVEAILSKVK